MIISRVNLILYFQAAFGQDSETVRVLTEEAPETRTTPNLECLKQCGLLPLANSGEPSLIITEEDN